MSKKDKRSVKRQKQLDDRKQEKKNRSLCLSRMVPQDHPALSAYCAPIKPSEFAEFAAVAELLTAVCRAHWNGVGLAAPQIGITSRAIVIWPDRMRGGTPRVLFNPVYVEKSETRSPSTESCLSYPGVEGTCLRHNYVSLTWMNPDGTLGAEAFHGFDAVVVQHEMDHLDGRCIVKLYRDGWRDPDLPHWKETQRRFELKQASLTDEAEDDPAFVAFREAVKGDDRPRPMAPGNLGRRSTLVSAAMLAAMGLGGYRG